MLTNRERLARGREKLARMRREARAAWDPERMKLSSLQALARDRERERKLRLAAQREAYARARAERRPVEPLPAPKRRTLQLFASVNGDSFWSEVGERVLFRHPAADRECRVCGSPTSWGTCSLCRENHVLTGAW